MACWPCSGSWASTTARPRALAFALVSVFVALALITIGLLSSTFHLGHPERAWRALSQWRSSPGCRAKALPRVATYVPALLFGAVWSGLVDAPNWIGPLGLITATLMCASPFSAPA